MVKFQLFLLFGSYIIIYVFLNCERLLFDNLHGTNIYHKHTFIQEIPMVTQKPTEETKTNIVTRKSVTQITKHETHTGKTKSPPDENIEDPQLKDAPLDPSDEEDTPKNKPDLKIKDISLSLKDKVNNAASISEYETESFPIESPTDDDVEKSILDLDSDVEPKPLHLKKQTKSFETKTKTGANETKITPKQEKKSKVCKMPYIHFLGITFLLLA